MYFFYYIMYFLQDISLNTEFVLFYTAIYWSCVYKAFLFQKKKNISLSLVSLGCETCGIEYARKALPS